MENLSVVLDGVWFVGDVVRDSISIAGVQRLNKATLTVVCAYLPNPKAVNLLNKLLN
jgi:hypothetical protein